MDETPFTTALAPAPGPLIRVDQAGVRPDKEVATMSKYVVLFSFTGDAINRFLESPGERSGPVRQLAEAAGGTLESYYWMFGQHDGLAIFDLPDSTSAAALSLAVTSTGAFRSFETHELIPDSDLVRISERAKALRSGYQAPWKT